MILPQNYPFTHETGKASCQASYQNEQRSFTEAVFSHFVPVRQAMVNCIQFTGAARINHTDTSVRIPSARGSDEVQRSEAVRIVMTHNRYQIWLPTRYFSGGSLRIQSPCISTQCAVNQLVKGAIKQRRIADSLWRIPVQDEAVERRIPRPSSIGSAATSGGSVQTRQPKCEAWRQPS